jgi:hypothetical protein
MHLSTYRESIDPVGRGGWGSAEKARFPEQPPPLKKLHPDSESWLSKANSAPIIRSPLSSLYTLLILRAYSDAPSA